MEVFFYSYMRRAFLTGFFIALILPCIGVVTVNKRIAVVGDALSHTSLAGIMLGLMIGINPIVGSVVFCIFAALAMEVIRKKFPYFSELSTAIIMSTGVGLASLFSAFSKTSSSFESFLFGSIVAVSWFELYFIIITSIVVILTFAKFYYELLFISFDESAAKLSGVPVDMVNFIFTILTAITVSISARTVGVLIISSMMVLPVACSMQISKSYFKHVKNSIIFGIIFMMTGIYFSYILNLKPGGTIVLIGVITLILIMTIQSIRTRLKSK